MPFYRRLYVKTKSKTDTLVHCKVTLFGVPLSCFEQKLMTRPHIVHKKSNLHKYQFHDKKWIDLERRGLFVST